MERKNFNSGDFEKLKEEADDGRMNNYPEKKDLYEGMEENKKVENNLTGLIEDLSSPNGSTSSSEKIKNSEINQEKIEVKSEKVKTCKTPKEKEKKINENSILEIKEKSEKVKTCKTPKEKEKKINEYSILEIKEKSEKVKIRTTPKENEDKMNEDSIEKKKEAISLNNVESDEKNMKLLGTKEPVEPFNMLIDSDSEDDIDMKNDNDGDKNQGINRSIIGSNQNEQEINFSNIPKINVNQKGYEGINSTYSLPIEDDDKLNSSCLSKIRQIQCNH
jgi:hypothetical protein